MKAKPRTQNISASNSQNVGVTENVQEQIRRRAYELYEQRGREDGRDVEDWLQSETEMKAKDARPDAVA